MKDWIFVTLIVGVLLIAMAAIYSCDPDAGEDDEVPVEPIEDED